MSDTLEAVYRAFEDTLIGFDLEDLEARFTQGRGSVSVFNDSVEELLEQHREYLLQYSHENISLRGQLGLSEWASKLFSAVREIHPVPAHETIFVIFEFGGFSVSAQYPGRGTIALRQRGISVLRGSQRSGAKVFSWGEVRKVSARDDVVVLHLSGRTKVVFDSKCFRFHKLDARRRDSVIDFMNILAEAGGES